MKNRRNTWALSTVPGAFTSLAEWKSWTQLLLARVWCWAVEVVIFGTSLLYINSPTASVSMCLMLLLCTYLDSRIPIRKQFMRRFASKLHPNWREIWSSSIKMATLPKTKLNLYSFTEVSSPLSHRQRVCISDSP